MTTWNWRTNLGGAISVLGTSLIGFGILPQLAGGPSNVLYWVAFAGFCLSAVGKALTAFFAADAAAVGNRMDQIDAHLQSTDKRVG
jgi:branched-subunit amino acid permease